MKPSKVDHSQDDIFSPRLSRLLNPAHELIKLSKLIPWKEFETEFEKLYQSPRGQPPKPIRLIVGLMMLQHMQGLSELQTIFEPALKLIDRLLVQKKEDSHKLYSLHAPETECIAKGKAHKKYEFGCKVSLVITHKEGLCLSSEALHGNPYDGHTLGHAVKEAEGTTGISIETVFLDRGYKGHRLPEKKVYISGQIRGMTAALKKALKRRQAIELQIGHMKSDGKLGRNFLKGIFGDKANALLAGIGHNLRLIRRWIELFLSIFFGWLTEGKLGSYLQAAI